MSRIYVHPTAQPRACVEKLQKQTHRTAVIRGHRVELVPGQFSAPKPRPTGPFGGAAA